MTIRREAKLAVWARDRYRCAECGERFPAPPPGKPWMRSMGNRITVDHVVPRSKGGTNEQSNLVAMCFDCNQAKADRMPLAKGARLTQRIELVVA